MAIKGLVGKEGNTLGTPERPWGAVYTDFGVFPDYSKYVKLSVTKKTITYHILCDMSNSYTVPSYEVEPSPENGYILWYLDCDSSGKSTYLVIGINSMDLYYMSPKPSLNSSLVPVRKGDVLYMVSDVYRTTNNRVSAFFIPVL